ncbi:MAG TPA: Crp/Fnr family transcriptional regulator [Stellaceae bacterium]|nr:Crp/Fnr family transcriptional regulator [Stellaceae bacterium]
MAGPTHEQKQELFQRHYLLGRLDPGEINILATRARAERYPAGREIFAKGSPGRSMSAVVSGQVKIASLSPTGKEIVFNVIHAGEVFGEIGVIDGEERTASAAAMTDCELLVLDRRDVLPLFERHPEICMILMRILCQRLRRTSEQVEDVLFRSLEARLAKALLQLAGDAEAGEPRGATGGLHLSQRELATMAGGSRESVNKLLQAWHKAGLIALARGAIVIRDAAALRRLV